MALLFPPCWSRLRRALDLTREGKRRAAHFVERPARLNADVDVQPAPPEVFGHPQVEVVDAAHAGGFPITPFHAGHRIEVDAQLVGMLEVFGAHRVRMQLQAGRFASQRAPGVARHHLLGRAARRKRSSTVSIQGGRLLGARFW